MFIDQNLVCIVLRASRSGSFAGLWKTSSPVADICCRAIVIDNGSEGSDSGLDLCHDLPGTKVNDGGLIVEGKRYNSEALMTNILGQPHPKPAHLMLSQLLSENGALMMTDRHQLNGGVLSLCTSGEAGHQESMSDWIINQSLHSRTD